MSLRKFTFDGLTIETTDAGVQAIEKLQGQLAAKDAAISAAGTSHQAAIAAKDAEIAKITAAKDAAEAKILDAVALDKLVSDRGDLISKAKAIAPAIVTTGLSDAAIRKAAVVAKLGDAAVAGKPEAYLDAMFDIIAKDAAPTDPVAAALMDGAVVLDARSEAEKARKEHTQSLRDGWKAPTSA